MSGIDFILEGLNATLGMDLSGALSGLIYSALDVSATAVYYVKTSDMRKVFKFQSDSFDITNADASDVKYFVHRDSTAWPTNLKLNPANAAMVIDGDEMLSTGVAATKNKLKHDFVRYLAKSLFNTVHGVDLFTNEEALLTDIVRGGRAARLAIETKLNDVAATNNTLSGPDVSSGYYYTTNADNDNTNICRELFLQLISSAPDRFNDLSNNTTGNPISIPLQNDDNFNFKVTVQAASNQNDLTNVATIDHRVYGVKIILVADPVAPDTDASLNVTPIETETGDNVGEYPYYTA